MTGYAEEAFHGSAVVVERLTKRYGDLVAVDDVSFSVNPAEVFVLLGPNGAGKTTTVEIAEGLREPDDGTVTILGDAPTSARVRERIGVMPQRGDLYAGIKTDEAIRLFAAFYDDADDPEAMLARLELTQARKTTYRRLSGGERRRLSLALALIGRPTVAFLDEPTAELDVEGHATVWQMITELRDRGSAVVLTTHELDEAERVADRVAIMRHGKLVASGTPDELAARAAPQITVTLERPIDRHELGRAMGCEVDELADGTYRLTGRAPDPQFVSSLTTWFAARAVLVRTLHAGPRSLAEVYMELTR